MKPIDADQLMKRLGKRKERARLEEDDAAVSVISIIEGYILQAPAVELLEERGKPFPQESASGKQ